MKLSTTLIILSNDLPRLIKNRRLTHDRLSKVLQVHSSTIARWMRNDFRNSSLSDFIKLIEYLESVEVIGNDYFEILTDHDSDCPKTTWTIKQTR